MKTKIPDQYLTDYALNELEPEERIYVESLLGASEEAREDVYQMIDLAMLLDQGFEREDEREQTALTAEQVFADFKRSLALHRREERRQAHAAEVSSPPVAPVVRRETRG